MIQIHLLADAVQVTGLSSALSAVLHYLGFNTWKTLVVANLAGYISTWYKNRFLTNKTWDEANVFHKVVGVLSATPLGKKIEAVESSPVGKVVEEAIKQAESTATPTTPIPPKV